MEKRTTGHILRLNLAAELTHGMCVSNLAFQVACEMGLPPETCHEMASSSADGLMNMFVTK